MGARDRGWLVGICGMGRQTGFFRRRIEFDQFRPKYGPVVLAEFADEFTSKSVDDLAVFRRKLFVAFFGSVP